jgi:hypothetical protein
MSMRLSETCALVPIVKPADNEAGATGESIFMSKLYRVSYLLTFGSITGDAVLTVKSGATDGVQTTSETFRYRLGTAAQGSAGADVFGAWASSSSLTLTAATFQNKLLECELDTRAITDGQPWLTLALSAAASVLFVSVVAVAEARIVGANVPTVLS